MAIFNSFLYVHQRVLGLSSKSTPYESAMGMFAEVTMATHGDVLADEFALEMAG